MGIIGVVAALTMSQLLVNFEKKRTVTILKRAYSDLYNYVEIFNLENDCNKNFANCTPENGEFNNEFVKFLQNKQNFNHYSAREGWICVDDGKMPTYNGKSFMISPTGSYAYYITPYMYDNFYTVKGIKDDLFRSRIFIITDLSKINDKLDYKLSCVGPKKLTSGRNMFELYVTNFNHIIPQGSPICTGWQYYCHPNNNGDEKNLQRIIEDGWEIKYSF